MFGYISINKAEMKFKDYDVYHSYYCGLCKVLKECYGRRGQVTLSFDMTFLVILLTGLYEPDTKTEMVRCIAHPMQKHAAKANEFTEYAAASTCCYLIISVKMTGQTNTGRKLCCRKTFAFKDKED